MTDSDKNKLTGPDYRSLSQKYTLANGLYEQKKFEESKALCLDILEQDSIDAEVHQLLGKIYIQNNEVEAALEAFHKAVELNPTDIDMVFNMAKLCQNQNKSYEALTYYQCALNIEPQHCASHYNMGLIYYEHQDYQNAITHFHIANTQQPKDVTILYHLALSFQAIDDMIEAECCFIDILKIDEHHVLAMNELGIAAHKQGRLQDAIGIFEQSLANNANQFEANYYLGFVYVDLEQWEDALSPLQIALKSSPNHLGALFKLAIVNLNLGHVEQSITYINQILKHSPNHPQALVLRCALMEETPKFPSIGYAKKIFNEKSCFYESHYIEYYNYKAPEQLCKLLAVHQNKTLTKVLDLGCGTGIVGVFLKDYFNVTELLGVDVSEQMIVQAEEKQVYNQLTIANVNDGITELNNNKPFQLVIAAELFPYIGNLENIFKTVITLLEATGLFAFTIESLSEGEYHLNLSGRYSHTLTYIHDLCTTFKLQVLQEQSCCLLSSPQQSVMGHLFIVQK